MEHLLLYFKTFIKQFSFFFMFIAIFPFHQKNFQLYSNYFKIWLDYMYQTERDLSNTSHVILQANVYSHTKIHCSHLTAKNGVVAMAEKFSA